MSSPSLRVLYVTSTRYDFTTATLVQGLNQLPGVELRTTTPGNYARPDQVIGPDDARAYGARADVVILGYNRGVDTALFWSIPRSKAARVFVEGGDSSELPVSRAQLSSLDVVFKREQLRCENSIENLWTLIRRKHPRLWGRMRCHALVPFPVFENGENRMTGRDFVRNLGLMSKRRKAHPFPYGIENRFRGTLNTVPTLELSCLLTCHTDDRRMLVERLRGLGLSRTFIGEIANEPGDVERLIGLGAVDGASRRDVELGQNLRYYDRIRCSRRCISVPGRGFDTLRFWEILGQGALLISKRIAIEMPHPPIEGKHYLAFDTWNELEELLRDSFRDPDTADDIRSNGHAFALRFHSTRARALYFLSTLSERGVLSAGQLVESGISEVEGS